MMPRRKRKDLRWDSWPEDLLPIKRAELYADHVLHADLVEVVEIRLKGGNRRDLFGIADLIVLESDGTTVFVQATDGDHHRNRVRKILDEPRTPRVLYQHHRFVEVWSFRYMRRQKRIRCLRTAIRKHEDGELYSVDLV